MHDLAGKGDVQLGAVDERLALIVLKIDRGNANDKARAVLGVNVQMQLAAHHFVDFEDSGDRILAGGAAQHDMLRTHAKKDLLRRDPFLVEQAAFLAVDLDLRTEGLDVVLAALVFELR